jgi:drug/metabolite transporter (DMT)-like permease
MGQHHFKVHLALFAVSFIYALTFSLVKDIMPYYLQGFGFIVIRVSGAAILFLLAGSQIKERIDWSKHGWRILACAVFGVAANMLMFFKGLEITSPINGAVLMLATPIFVLLLNLLINKERMNILQAIGILMAAIGSVLLMSGKSFGFSSATYVGDLLILFNAISYAMYLVLAKALLSEYHTLTVSKYTFLIGALLVLPFGYSELMQGKFSEMPMSIVLEVLFIIVCTTFVTYLLNAWAIKQAGPNIVGAYIYLQPILATIIAVILKKDILNTYKMFAILLIFAGVFTTTKQLKWYKSKA